MGGHAPPSPSQEKLLEDSYSPVMLAKAVKNNKEQELLRAAHVRAVPISSPSSRRGVGGGSFGCCSPPHAPARCQWAVPRFGTRWLSSSTCCGWRRWCRRGRWTSFWVPATSMPSDGQCCPPTAAPGGCQHRVAGTSLASPPPAAFQGPAAQPRAQLRVHLRQRAQRSARPLQVWGQGLGMRSCRGVPGTMAGALTPLPSPAHPTPANGRCRWMRCTCRTPAGSTCAYPTPSPRPTVPLSWLRPALQESGPLLMSPFAGMAPQTSRGPCTGAPRPHSRRCWHHGAIPAMELGLLPEAEAGCAGGGSTGTSVQHHAQHPRAALRKPTPAC